MYDTKLVCPQIFVHGMIQQEVSKQDDDASLVIYSSIKFKILATEGKITQKTKLTSIFPKRIWNNCGVSGW